MPPLNLEKLDTILNTNVALESFELVESSTSRLTEDQARAALTECYAQFSLRRRLHDEDRRVAWAKSVVALLPASLQLLEHVLLERRDEIDYECHFSLFCFLDEVPCYDRLKPAKGRVLAAVRSYLLTVDLDCAQAAWMAGDLLGDHWQAVESGPILLDAAANASSEAGRAAALYGLKMLLSRNELGLLRTTLRRVLTHIVENDPCDSVRDDAFELRALLAEPEPNKNKIDQESERE